MPRIPEDARAKLNTGFAERLERVDPPFLDVLVQTRKGEAQGVADRLTQLDEVTLGSKGIIADEYIAATVPEAALSDIARIPGVTLIHQDQPVSIQQMPTPADISNLAPQVLAGDVHLPLLDYNPVADYLSDSLFNFAAASDTYVGDVRISDVEVPRVNFSQLPPGNPLRTATVALDRALGGGLSGETIIPTVEVVSWMRNSPLTNAAIRNDTKVGIIDTGHTPLEPENGGRAPLLQSFVDGEPGLDLMGHGSWCTNMVTGEASPGIWGTTAGVAPGSNYAHFKALNTFPGFGMTSWILAAMEAALEWGADVISMSLGGVQQGDVDEDPYCQFIRDNCKENAGDEDGAIFVVAAGNSGPDEYTIGSPGVAPKALTVGAWSLTDEAPSVFSSRGPQGAYYKDKPQDYEEDLAKYGAFEFVKPDITAPGGGRKNSALAGESDEVLFQGTTGWYDGMIDGLKDNKASMKGTSMATPAAAGLVKRLYDAGIIKTAAEVKQVVSDRAVVAEYEEAADGANVTEQGKNIAVGFGQFREAMFEPRQVGETLEEFRRRIGELEEETEEQEQTIEDIQEEQEQEEEADDGGRAAEDDGTGNDTGRGGGDDTAGNGGGEAEEANGNGGNAGTQMSDRLTPGSRPY